MDAEPSCAICSAPNHAGCLCESERLQIALDQAESRAMDARLADIRYAQTARTTPAPDTVIRNAHYLTVNGSSPTPDTTSNSPSSV